MCAYEKCEFVHKKIPDKHCERGGRNLNRWSSVPRALDAMFNCDQGKLHNMKESVAQIKGL